MLKSTIAIDLPSTLAGRTMTTAQWARDLFESRLDLRGDHEELTISAMSLVAGLVEGFSGAGVDDVISFVVDKRVIYVDTRDVDGDLEEILAAARHREILENPFNEMHLVLSRKESGLHVLIETCIRNRVLMGDDEMNIELSARIEELQIQPGDSAEAYRARIESFMKDIARIAAYRQALDAVTRRIADAVTLTLRGTRTQAHPAVVRIIRPGIEQLARFRKLPFGANIERPHYRPVPTYLRSGAYADPFFYYYHDPYYDLMNWVMLDSMLHQGHWRSPAVEVIAPSGVPLGNGADLTRATHAWEGRDTVSIRPDRVTVDPSIPDPDDHHSPWFTSGADTPTTSNT
jgi:hypothetical protein